MDDLKAIWKDVTARYTTDVELVDQLWAEIKKEYTAKKRHYHNLEHLTYMVDKATQHRDQLTDPDTILFSIFYHDLIYHTGRQDNEQKSADIAGDRLTKLGVPTAKIVACQHQIVATKEHNNTHDTDTNYLVDFDLAILGDTPENYKTYTQKIRDEYSVYPNFLYRRGRRKVLRHFLNMDRIFKTKEFFDGYEQQARENMEIELKEL